MWKHKCYICNFSSSSCSLIVFFSCTVFLSVAILTLGSSCLFTFLMMGHGYVLKQPKILMFVFFIPILKILHEYNKDFWFIRLWFIYQLLPIDSEYVSIYSHFVQINCGKITSIQCVKGISKHLPKVIKNRLSMYNFWILDCHEIPQFNLK